MTILVVDDEQIVRDVAQRILERAGYRVLLAPSGQAAIDLLERNPTEISIVVLDVSMPNMSGFEVLPRLRGIRPELKILLSSGYSEAEILRKSAPHRVDGFIHKPYTAAYLIEAIGAVS